MMATFSKVPTFIRTPFISSFVKKSLCQANAWSFFTVLPTFKSVINSLDK